MSDEEIEHTEEEQLPEESWGDRMLVAGKPLSPRHKKLAELLAQGKSNDAVAKELNYTPSRVSILKSNTLIKQEIERVQERIYVDTVEKRLKDNTDPAMNVIETCLKDETNAFTKAHKLDTAKWVVEMVNGKATQKTEHTGSILVGVIDRLDAMKSAGKVVEPTQLLESNPQPTALDGDFVEVPKKLDKTEEDLLRDWVISYNPKS